VSARAGATRGFLGRRVAPVSNGCRVVMRAGNWLPGSDAPAWLPDSLPGNYGGLAIAAQPGPGSVKQLPWRWTVAVAGASVQPRPVNSRLPPWASLLQQMLCSGWIVGGTGSVTQHCMCQHPRLGQLQLMSPLTATRRWPCVAAS
jgi:hypothetical protein